MTGEETLEDLGEDGLIQRLTRRVETGAGVVAGVGEDCAVVEGSDPEAWQLYKVDSVVEGIHFSPELDAAAAGRKAVARTMSDFAAMGGGSPRLALVNFAAPPEYLAERAGGYYEGIRNMLAEHGVFLVGGETVSVPAGGAVVISVFLAGDIPRAQCRFRSAAEAGDLVAVTGKLGGSLESGRHWRFEPRFDEGKVLGNSNSVHAMMDLSDGLARDLPRLAAASGVGYRVDFDKIPRHDGCDLDSALGDGEDYELLVTVAPDGPIHDLPVTVIGEITRTVETPLEGGWDHFSSSGS